MKAETTFPFELMPIEDFEGIMLVSPGAIEAKMLIYKDNWTMKVKIRPKKACLIKGVK